MQTTKVVFMLTNVGRTKDGYICTLKKRRSNEDQWTVYENISMSGWFNYLVTTGQVKLDTEYHQDDLPDDVSKQPFKLSTFLYSDKTLNNYYSDITRQRWYRKGQDRQTNTCQVIQ